MTRLEDLVAVIYRLPTPADFTKETLERVGRPGGPDRWAIRDGRFCLNKSGCWEHEPLPSSRDEAFYARCRFDTAAEALAAWDRLANKEEG